MKSSTTHCLTITACAQILHMSRDGGTSQLNRQVIAVLSGKGVPDVRFFDLRDAAVGVMQRCCDSERDAWTAVALSVGMAGASDDSEVTSWLRCGLFGEPYVMLKLWSSCQEKILRMRDKLNIPVLKSRRCLMVSDPTGLLNVSYIAIGGCVPCAWLAAAVRHASRVLCRVAQEGEVYYRCSNAVFQNLANRSAMSPVEGCGAFTVLGSVVLARNPCHREEDVQVATAVDVFERMEQLCRCTDGATPGVVLRGGDFPGARLSLEAVQQWRAVLVDVVLIPTTGMSSFAQLLSGGDFDGDQVWVSWDERLTEPLLAALTHGTSAMPAVPPASTALAVQARSTSSASNSASWDLQRREAAALFLRSLKNHLLLCHATNLHLAWLDKFLSDRRPNGSSALCATCLTLRVLRCQ